MIDKAQEVSWSTKNIDQFNEDINSGIQRKDNPYYFGNVYLRKPNLLYEYTQEEINELIKCKNDVNYFANHYAYTMSPTTGTLERITLRDYQEDLLHTITDNRFTIIVASRQSGKTISSSIYLAWYALFNIDKTIFICANKEKTARDIIGKVQEVIMNVPFFMKPGVNKWGSLECKFDNGCRIIGEATTPRSGIGFTIHCLYLDEFAHVEKGIIDEFYDNIYPTVSSLPDSKIIITSTPNGMNRFYQLYQAAVKGINSFKPFRIDWWQVPDWNQEKKCWVKRDEKWMNQTIKDLGGDDEELGRERFGKQFGNSFLSTGDLLLGPNALKTLEQSQETFIYQDLPIFEDNDIEEARYLKFRSDIDLSSIRQEDELFLFSVDLAEGHGGDNSVINIFKVKLMDREDWDKVTSPDSVRDFVGLEQVGIFCYNKINLHKFAKLLYILTTLVFNDENIRIILEWNAFGGEVYNSLQNVFGEKNDFDLSTILKFKRTLDSAKLEPGLKLNKDNKLIYCQNCRKNIASKRLILHDTDTINEFNLFGRKNNSYAAIVDHDDRVMTCVNANALFDTRDFGWMADEVIEKAGDRAGELYDYITNRTFNEL